MKILFVAEGFAPDSVIGALRITKFAKYLSEFGHEITVLCSPIFVGKEDPESLKGLEKVKIFRFETEDNLQALKVSNGKQSERALIRKVMPRNIYLFLKEIYEELVLPVYYYKDTKKTFVRMLSCYQKYLSSEEFDFVFATYSTMADVLMGEYINKTKGTRMILDLRDRMDNALQPFVIRKRNYKLQEKMINIADKTFIVSEAAKDELKHDYPDVANKIITLYNGYDDKKESLTVKDAETKTLSFAYTGGLYSGKRDLRPLFRVIGKLRKKYGYEFKINYAGEDIEELHRQASQTGQNDIIQNFGNVSREEAERIQNGSDIFLVISWNDKRLQSALPGKFFEGIRAEKPILTIITGDEMNSELYLMNNIYNYGFCYEEKQNNSLKELYSYVKTLYEEKMDGELVKFRQNNKMREKFHYRNLTRELEGHLLEILSENAK